MRVRGIVAVALAIGLSPVVSKGVVLPLGLMDMTWLVLKALTAPRLRPDMAAGDKALTWPALNAALLVEATVEIPIQVNGKLRDRIVVKADASQEEIEKAALACAKVKPFLEGKTIKKIIIVPKKLVNLVVC